MGQTEVKTRKPVKRQPQQVVAADETPERVVLPPRYSGLVWLTAFAFSMRLALSSIFKRLMPRSR